MLVSEFQKYEKSDLQIAAYKKIANLKHFLHRIRMPRSCVVTSFFQRLNIMKTRPCNVHPFTPHSYVVILGFTGVYIFSSPEPKAHR